MDTGRFMVVKLGVSASCCFRAVPESRDAAVIQKIASLDLWQPHDYKALGIVGQPYLDVDFTQVFYLPDTGQRWMCGVRLPLLRLAGRGR